MTTHSTNGPLTSGIAVYFCDACGKAHLRMGLDNGMVLHVDDITGDAMRALAGQAQAAAAKQDERERAGHG